MSRDETLSIGDLLNMFKKAKILDTDRISTSEFIEIVEKYHAKGDGQRLCEKLSEESFKTFVAENPTLLPINRELQQL